MMRVSAFTVSLIIFTALITLSTTRIAIGKENGVSQEVKRPPNDDSKTSTVRVSTAWVDHNLDKNGCLSRAATVLANDNYFVDPTDGAVYGLKEGMTVSFRCDHKGVVFVVVAYRKRPDQATQTRIIEGLRDAFSGKP